MTLSVDIFAVVGDPPARKVGELRWRSGSSKGIDVVSGGERARAIASDRIKIGRDVMPPDDQPEKFMRSLFKAYSGGYVYLTAARESQTTLE